MRFLPFLLFVLASSVVVAGPESTWRNAPETHPRGPVGMKLRADRPAAQHYIMGPLGRIQNRRQFEAELREVAALGFDGVTTDVWWSWVEPEPGVFDWEYFRWYAGAVKSAGLKWLPILSFHSAGGNVGDDVDIPLRPWIWKTTHDMKFVAANGYVSDEYISFWVPEAYDLYERVMRSFAENFSDFRDVIAKIYLGMGPAGELRFPSYAPRNGWVYPGIGEFQAFSERAKRGFREWLKRKYPSLEVLRESWGVAVEWETISPPRDGEEFFRHGYQTPYGKDFLLYYRTVLEEHLFELLSRGRKVFLPFGPLTESERFAQKNWQGGFLPLFYGPSTLNGLLRPEFRNGHGWQDSQHYWHLRSLEWRDKQASESRAPFLGPGASLGVKLAGVHWQRLNPDLPGAAEKAAGYGKYEDLLGLIRVLGASLTFTCMEMEDGAQAQGFPAYSAPRSLVLEVADSARVIDLPLYGENALTMRDNLRAFENVRKVFGTVDVHGFTLLRWGDIFDAAGRPNQNARWHQQNVFQRLSTRIEISLDETAEFLAKAGIEFRAVGPAKELGGGDPAKGVRLLPVSPYHPTWEALVELNDPDRIRFQVVAYRPDTGQSVPVSPWYEDPYVFFLNGTAVATGWSPRDVHGGLDALGCPMSLLAAASD